MFLKSLGAKILAKKAAKGITKWAHLVIPFAAFLASIFAPKDFKNIVYSKSIKLVGSIG